MGSTLPEVFAQHLLEQTPGSKASERLHQSLVFLDAMDHVGVCADNTAEDTREILREITEAVEGTSIRLGLNKEVDTRAMFFICFGVSQDSSLNNSAEDSSRTSAAMPGPPVVTTTASMDTSSSSNGNITRLIR